MINISFFEQLVKTPERFLKLYDQLASSFLRLADIAQLLMLIAQWDDGSMSNQISLI